jgi:hypothetical protein
MGEATMDASVDPTSVHASKQIYNRIQSRKLSRTIAHPAEYKLERWGRDHVSLEELAWLLEEIGGHGGGGDRSLWDTMQSPLRIGVLRLGFAVVIMWWGNVANNGGPVIFT